MSWEAVGQVVGITTSKAVLALFLQAVIRRLLRHSGFLWASRTDSALWAGGSISNQWDKQWEYRFAIQNLEPVPIDRSMRIIIAETGFTDEWLNEGVQQGQIAIRVYSGRTRPSFIKTRAILDGMDQVAFYTELKCEPMLGNDTWTVKVRSKARTVKIALVPAGAPLQRINPLKPWLGITLSASELEIGEDTTSPVRNGPSELPTKATGVAVAAIGPVLYLFMMIVMWSFDSSDVLELGWFPLVDLLILVALGLIGRIWYRWVRRPVYPTIQSYHRYYWARDRDQHEERDADVCEPIGQFINKSLMVGCGSADTGRDGQEGTAI